MSRPTDEMLMAFADGALDAHDRATIAEYLATDAEARRIVESFRRTAGLARDAFDPALETPPPQALVDTILGRRAPVPPERSNVITFKRFEWKVRPAVPTSLPIAASIALVAGVGVGLLVARTSDPGTLVALGPQARGSTLAEVLERAPTGARRDHVVVMATFRDRLDRPCREIELGSGAGSKQAEFAAVACRHSDGTWIVEGAARLTQQTTTADTAYVPSGARETDALDSLLSLLGAKPVLTPAQEKSLIEKGWE